MKTVADIMVTINSIRKYVERIDKQYVLEQTDLTSISELLEDYETILLNLKVKD